MAKVSIAEVALGLGGALTTAGSICAVLALLNRPGKETLNSIAVCFLGLGTVLLLWPVVSERSEGIRIYWGGLILLVLSVAILALSSYLSSSPKDELPVVEDVKESRHLDHYSHTDDVDEDRPR